MCILPAILSEPFEQTQIEWFQLMLFTECHSSGSVRKRPVILNMASAEFHISRGIRSSNLFLHQWRVIKMRRNAMQKVLLQVPVFHPSLSKENECQVQSHRHDAGPNPSRLDITLCCGAVKPLFELKDEIIARIICCRHCLLG